MRYGLILYVKQITFILLKFNAISASFSNKTDNVHTNAALRCVRVAIFAVESNKC